MSIGRRGSFSALAGVGAAVVAKTLPEPPVVIDCRVNHDGIPRRVFVDGVEIKGVWYVDTAHGFVRTYDVFGDGLAHSVYEGKSREFRYRNGAILMKEPPLLERLALVHQGIEIGEQGVFWKQIHGKVRLERMN